MKQMIVNVSGLSVEEKQRVSEALAKIENVSMCNPLYWDAVVLLYGPSSDGVNVGFGYYETAKTTHTPQQVLEMAPSVDQDVILADTLIITDSSGNIIYDSTLDALNQLIKKRADSGKGGALPDNGVSVKLNKNGAAVMVEKRKVRADFDLTKEYSVDVSKCTEAEKKAVQQAFFDAGIEWEIGGKEYKRLYAAQYTNTTVYGRNDTYLMYSTDTNRCNMTAKEFLGLVYEPEQQGHVHSDLMAKYAEDAKTSKTPWELWEYLDKDDGWTTFRGAPGWYETSEYRRKPKTHIVHGVEVPDLRITPKEDEKYWSPDTNTEKFVHETIYWQADTCDRHRVSYNLCYEHTEAGKQAAILHAKAMLGVQP